MSSFFSQLAMSVSIGLAAVTACAVGANAENGKRAPDIDRAFVIVMENNAFDTMIGQKDPRDPSGKTLLTPYITQLAFSQGLETFYFGTHHPSEPNYHSMIAGDFFVDNDNGNCFDPNHGSNCNAIDAPNLVDQLEKKNISWEGLAESMPSVGFLGASWPDSKNRLYADKHFPFVFFKDIALNPSRLAKLKPFDLEQLKLELANPATASRFVFIAPNQCNDMHGTGSCSDKTTAISLGDAFLARTVPAIMNSPSFTEHSVIFITWDEGGGDLNCCGRPEVGGGHVPTIVVTKHGKPVKDASPTDHNSLLATIEDGFGLPRLANAKNAETLKAFPNNNNGKSDF